MATREYRDGERVVVGNYLADVQEVGPKLVRLPATGPVEAGWWKREQIVRYESEAVGRLVTELFALGEMEIKHSVGDVRAELWRAHEEPVVGVGDNVGHALWLLKEQVEEGR